VLRGATRASRQEPALREQARDDRHLPVLQEQREGLAHDVRLDLVHEELLVLHRVAEGHGAARPVSPQANQIHRPLRREAAILSRVRSEIMDLSNSANDINMLSVSRPIASAVEKFCVTETNDAPAAVKRSIILAKSSSERLRRSTL